MKELIKEFLDKYCTVVAKDIDDATNELMMDDHTCIEYDGVQYFVPRNNSFFTEDDELTQQMLNATFGL